MVVQATDLDFLTAVEAGALFRSRELSPVELTRHLLERSERLQSTLLTFVTLTPERALAEARSAEAAFLRGDGGSPLLGIPVGYKDIYMTAGVKTTGGSQLFEDYVPDEDATTVALLQQAGTVMLGKLTTWEFASGGGDLLQSYLPSARNPWDLDRSPAGSSSGSGAALAAGLVIGALGTDTGGSIRGPAAACGIVGLKPTFGRCSRYGVYPLSWALDHTGPMARTVADTALLLNAMAAYDPKDAHSAAEPVDDYCGSLDLGVKGLRLGMPTDPFFEGCDAEETAAVQAAARVLAGLGATIVPIEMPAQRPMNFAVEAHAWHRADLLNTPWKFGPNLAQRMLAAGGIFASEYIQISRMRAMLKEEIHQILLGVDAILAPTQPKPASLITDAVKEAARRTGASYTSIFNQVGLPSLSLPAGFSGEGLPLSLMINGRPFADATVLRIGHAYEQATSWHKRHPAL